MSAGGTIPLNGFEGEVQIDGTTGAAIMGNVEKWDLDISFKDVESGPYIGGDGTTLTNTTTKMAKGKLECTIPVAGDAAQAALLVKALAFASFSLTLIQDDGLTFTCPVAKVSGLKVTTDGAGIGKLSFDFKNSGSFTLV